MQNAKVLVSEDRVSTFCVSFSNSTSLEIIPVGNGISQGFFKFYRIKNEHKWHLLWSSYRHFLARSFEHHILMTLMKKFSTNGGLSSHRVWVNFQRWVLQKNAKFCRQIMAVLLEVVSQRLLWKTQKQLFLRRSIISELFGYRPSKHSLSRTVRKT